MPNLLPILILASIWCGSAVFALLPFVIGGMPPSLRLISVAAAPILFIFAFTSIAGLISLLGQKGIKRGKFPREALHPVYLLRRIYGLAWTQVYYFKPLYATVLAVPFFKKYVFRLFGYKGPTDFTIYPDTWIRDLPILEIGSGAYLSNRATIGTNICLADGTIYVGPIKIKDRGLIGHLAMLAPGVLVGEGADVGVGCAIGIKVKIGKGASIKPSCTLNHGALLRDGAQIGTMSFIGLRAEIGAGVSLPAGSNIPAGAIIKTQQDAANYRSSETSALQIHRDNVFPVALRYVGDE